MRSVWTRRLKLRSGGQGGDTIVEVLISIAVVSLLLSGAFVLARHSTRSVQDAQEHTAAQELLRTQVEQVRSALLAVDPANPDPALDPSKQAGSFCMTSATTLVASSNNACKNQSGLYTVQVTRNASDHNLYTFAVTWDEIGDGTGQESMVYRVYPRGSLDLALANGNGTPSGGSAPTHTCNNGDSFDEDSNQCFRRVRAIQRLDCQRGGNPISSSVCAYAATPTCNNALTYEQWQQRTGNNPYSAAADYYVMYHARCTDLNVANPFQFICPSSGNIWISNDTPLPSIDGRPVLLKWGCHRLGSSHYSCDSGTTLSGNRCKYTGTVTYTCPQGTPDGAYCDIYYAPTIT